MCVIIHKPASVSPPSEETLKQCKERNKDGIGIAIRLPDGIHIKKGITLKTLNQLLQEHKDKECVIHFRLATQGWIDAGNCHPFPIETDINLLRRTNLVTNYAVAHNGIFSDFDEDKVKVIIRRKGKKRKTNAYLSDTQQFIRKVLAPLKENLDSPALKYLLEETCRYSNKLVIMTPRETYRVGSFELEEDGCYYSNTRFKPVVIKYNNDWWYNRNYNNNYGNYNNSFNDYTKKCSECGTYLNVHWSQYHMKYLCDLCTRKLSKQKKQALKQLEKKEEKPNFICQMCGKKVGSIIVRDNIEMCSECFEELKDCLK